MTSHEGHKVHNELRGKNSESLVSLEGLGLALARCVTGGRCARFVIDEGGHFSYDGLEPQKRNNLFPIWATT